MGSGTPLNIRHDPLLSWVHKRIFRENGCCNILITGDTGSGKSWLSAEFGSNVDPKFNGMPYWDLPAFLKAVVKTKYKGQVNFFEEVGTVQNLQSRNFASKKNKLASSAFQILRFTNGINILTVPAGMFVDKQVRQLMHLMIKVSHHDERFTYAQVVMLETGRDGTIYDKFPRFKDKNGDWYVAEEVVFYKPKKEIVKEYEKTMEKMKTEWLNQYITELTEVGGTEEMKPLNMIEIEKIILNKRSDFEKDLAGRVILDINDITYFFEKKQINASHSNIKKVVRRLNKLLREGKSLIENLEGGESG